MHSKTKDTEISKCLSWLLRHGAIKEGLPMQPDGFVEVSALLNHKTLKNKSVSLSDVERIVQYDQKQRYKMKTEQGVLKIKANQGHSIQEVNKLLMKKVMSLEEIPLVVHGTYFRFWEKIKTEGLRRMRRNEMHFSNSDQISPKEVHSGFRSDCEILIYIDVQKAMQDGVQFFISENKVILSSGIDGVISAKYFAKVLDRKTNMLIDNK